MRILRRCSGTSPVRCAVGLVFRVRRCVGVGSRTGRVPATDVEPTVATIVNVEELRKNNAFYNKAENGDHLVVTTERAILYDPDEDIILDVIPVQLQPAEPATAPAEPK